MNEPKSLNRYEIDRVAENIVELMGSNKRDLPIAIVPVSLSGGATVERSSDAETVIMVKLDKDNIIKRESFDINIGSEAGGQFILKGELETYKWINPVTKKEGQAEIPYIGECDDLKILKAAADCYRYAEALRTLVTSMVCANPAIAKYNLPDTGIVLADKLLNSTGVSATVQSAIGRMYKGEDINKVNSYIRDINKERALVSTRDKTITALAWKFINGTYNIVDIISKNKYIPAVSRIEKTDAAPVTIKHSEVAIKPIDVFTGTVSRNNRITADSII